MEALKMRVFLAIMAALMAVSALQNVAAADAPAPSPTSGATATFCTGCSCCSCCSCIWTPFLNVRFYVLFIVFFYLFEALLSQRVQGFVGVVAWMGIGIFIFLHLL
ncbi:hypothetical protein OIU78_022440 [Salix suchowensis]|nr:hypothetical protein OIU78_022440 [Salix suchowensis]